MRIKTRTRKKSPTLDKKFVSKPAIKPNQNQWPPITRLIQDSHLRTSSHWRNQYVSRLYPYQNPSTLCFTTSQFIHVKRQISSNLTSLTVRTAILNSSKIRLKRIVSPFNLTKLGNTTKIWASSLPTVLKNNDNQPKIWQGLSHYDLLRNNISTYYQ